MMKIQQEKNEHIMFCKMGKQQIRSMISAFMAHWSQRYPWLGEMYYYAIYPGIGKVLHIII